jgi:enediyne biosynthesis protein E4
LHFGLGAAAKADLDIRWPNGQMEKIANLPANQMVTVQEGKGVIKSETFPKRNA